MNFNRRTGICWVAGVLFVISLLAGPVQAAEGAVSADVEQKVRNTLQVLLPNVVPDSVRTTPIPGLIEVVFGPRLVYMTEDGRYLVQGNMIDLEQRENLTERRLAKAKAKAIEDVGENNMVIYGPKTSKYTVTVFTDIDCGYCRKLHAEMAQYNAAGIRVRYLYYPRAGLESDSYRKAVASWCADDRNQALTDAKRGVQLESRQCENPVKAHYELGNLMGVQGTPAIVMDNGQVVPGYVPPERLRQALDQSRLSAGLR